MTLAPPRAGIVRIEHPTLGGEAYVTLTAYREVWYALGWRSPLDDPLWTGVVVVEASPVEWYVAAGVPVGVTTDAPYFLIDTDDDGAVYIENGL